MSIDVSTDGAVATVTINQPAKKNALTFDMRTDLIDCFTGFATNDAVRAVVLTGAGDAFCSGADVQAMGTRELVSSRARMKNLHGVILAIYRLDKPVIAAVRGAAVGFGWSLALASDLVIASETAKFAQIFKRVGLAPDGGAVWFLTRQIGFAKAKELVYNARTVSAAEALELGLVNRVVDDVRLMQEALALAHELSESATFALTMAKQMFAASMAPSLEQFLDTEILMQPQLTQTSDYAEGTNAFKEKRKAVFVGR